MVIKTLGIWLLILVFAFLNGALREFVLLPRLGAPVAPALSGILLSIVILLIAYALVPKLGVHDGSTLFQVGAIWLGMTLLFEFGYGRLVQHRSWTELFEPYTFHNGNTWLLVVVTTLFAPYVVMQLRARV